MSYHAVVMRIRRAKEKVKEKVLKRLSGVVILPWRRIGEVVRYMAAGVTTKVAITGAVIIMLGGAGIWIGRHGEEEPAVRANKVEVEEQADVRGSAVEVRRSGEKEDGLTYEEFWGLIDGLTDEYLEDEMDTSVGGEIEEEGEAAGSISADEITDEEVEEEGGEDIEYLIKQIRYEQLARLLPRYLELAQEYHDLQKMRDYIQSLPPCEEVVMFHKREHEICKEWIEVLKELARLFPEAVIYKPRTPDSPGYSSIDYRKLRELVGGRLPVEPYFRP